ncbi:MAG: ABC transporter permease [Eubacteriales bacterium]|nr:ABC transporter permease [Eubacteriales bacterium]
MKKKSVQCLLVFAVCAAVLAWAWAQTAAVGDDLQYLITAPLMVPTAQQADPVEDGQSGQDEASEGLTQQAVRPNQAALDLWDSLKTKADSWGGVIQTYTMSGILEKASLTSDTSETKQARLTALNVNAFQLEPEYLLFGRLFYPEELASGSDGILLDEQLALALFKISQPIGRAVTVSGVDFTVIGVLRHTKRVGDAEDYGAYVTLASLWDREIQLQALQVTARPVSGAGARSLFNKDMEIWYSDGTSIDLGKESMGAMLPVRVLLFFAGCVAFFRLLAVWSSRFQHFFADYRRRLSREYAVRLMPRLIIGVLTLAAGYGILALVAAVLVRYIVEPVYMFTEWVPTVLVEWKDIQTAFWNVWRGAAGLRELRSPQMCRLRYFATLTGWFSAAAAVAFTALWINMRATKREGKGAVETEDFPE